MQIKRFEAKNMTSALRMIKKELGPDAVILSARSLRKGKGFFGSMRYAGVEVSAAIDNQGPVIKGTDFHGEKNSISNPAGTRSARAYASGKSNRGLPPAYTAQGQASRRRYEHTRQSTSSRGNRAHSSLYQRLLDQNVERSIASELIEEMKRIPASQEFVAAEDLKFDLISLLEEMGVAADRNAFAGGKSGILAFVGTTGVGKTTTVAKLAAHQANRYGKHVALITVDNYGIAANEQLKAYARIIGIPMEAAFNPAEFKRALKKFKDKELILIDTPGINPTNQGELQEIKTYLDKIADPQIHLVLSAATKGKDLVAIAKSFQEIGVDRLLFTKVDESRVLGNLVNVMIRTNIKLSFIGRGRKVPEDIEAGSVEKIVDLLFQIETADRGQPVAESNPLASKQKHTKNLIDDRPHFVANKNSDVYHNPNCKWAKKIRSGNLVKFIGTLEAEAQNFLPCRSCNPDRLADGVPITMKTDKRKISNYH